MPHILKFLLKTPIYVAQATDFSVLFSYNIDTERITMSKFQYIPFNIKVLYNKKIGASKMHLF